MSETICAYCWKSVCSCGAEDYGDAPKDVETMEERGMPFFYNGYVVWPLRNLFFSHDVMQYVFYLGHEVVEVIELSIRTMKEWVPEGCAPMDLVWDLFCAAQGDEVVIEIQAWNKKRPAKLQVTRVDDGVF